MKYCCYVWSCAPSSYLELLDMERLLVLHLLSLLNPWLIVVYLKALSIVVTLVDVHLSWLNCFHFLILEEGPLAILIDCMIFFVTIARCYKDVYVNSFFPPTARLWNSLPIECFSLTNDLHGFNSRINRHLINVGSF